MSISIPSGTTFETPFVAGMRLRIDHMLLSPALADRLVDAQVDVAVRGWDKSSDHAPVWVELADGRKPSRRSGQRQRENPGRS